MRAYIDSDILIWHLRGKKEAERFFKKLSHTDNLSLYIGAMQRAEIVFFMRPTEEEGTKKFLSQFKTAPVDEEIVDTASALYRKFKPSHGIDINDALLAATCQKTGGVIYTLNTKHFPMRNIAVVKAW